MQFKNKSFELFTNAPAFCLVPFYIPKQKKVNREFNRLVVINIQTTAPLVREQRTTHVDKT